MHTEEQVEGKGGFDRTGVTVESGHGWVESTGMRDGEGGRRGRVWVGGGAGAGRAQKKSENLEPSLSC